MTQMIVAVLERAGRVHAPELAGRLQDLTVTSNRFDFFGPLIAGTSMDALLSRACALGGRYCLVQLPGHIPARHHGIQSARHANFFEALAAWVPNQEFLVGGRLYACGENSYGLGDLCFVIDLHVYGKLGRPAFALPSGGSASAFAVKPCLKDGALIRLEPSGTRLAAAVDSPGPGIIGASLRAGIPICGFDDTVLECSYDVRPRDEENSRQFAKYLGEGIFEHRPDGDEALTTDQRGFISFIRGQALHAKRGVFLGNWEDYRDLKKPPPGYGGPVSSFYSVAAGFKPNRILDRLGFSRSTRVVFFDYSRVALEIRTMMLGEWDGRDYPDFVRRTAPRFPEAWYQLKGNRKPGTLNFDLVAALWDRETELWGGALSFYNHWKRYRELRHDIVECDLYHGGQSLLATMRPEKDAVIWWSNSFHSRNAIWFYDREQREHAYGRWLENAARIAPDLFVYGADVNNLDISRTVLREHLELRA